MGKEYEGKKGGRGRMEGEKRGRDKVLMFTGSVCGMGMANHS